MLVNTYKQAFDLLALHRENVRRFPYLLESAAHGQTWTLGAHQEFVPLKNTLGRYSLLFAFPQEQLTLDARWVLHYDGRDIPENFSSNDFLSSFDQLLEQTASEDLSTFPFMGGWFVYLGYELAQQIEPTLSLPMSSNPEEAMPIAQATRIPCAIIYDHELFVTHVIAEEGFADEFNAVCSMLDALQNTLQDTDTERQPIKLKVEQLVEDDPSIYTHAIRKTHEYIRNGDIFQANLSREWRAVVDSNPADVYQKLRETNPGPFAGLAVLSDPNKALKHAVISSSPERLLSIRDRRVDTRPIAGTRARSQQADDEIMRQELIKHPKERAEHVMLIDLERNDIGRICEYGSVTVDELMVIETYEHVHHIVSNVTGIKREDVTVGAAIRAVFPGGTITGCPKVRCMEIIAELEQKPREAYTGAMGYVSHNGDMDLNILIRTMQMQSDESGSQLKFRAGGGIVFDSDADREVHETRAKARGLVQALQE